MYEGHKVVRPFYSTNPTKRTVADRLAEKTESLFVFIKQALLLLAVVAAVIFYIYLKSTPGQWSRLEQKEANSKTTPNLSATPATTVDSDTVTSLGIGASEATISGICGRPDRVSTTTTALGARNTWIYREREYDRNAAYWEVVNTRCDGHMFLFEQGKVIVMSDSY